MPYCFISDECGYSIIVPTFNIDTFEEYISDVMEMARAAIGVAGIEYQDKGMELLSVDRIVVEKDDVVICADIDFVAFDVYQIKISLRRRALS